MLEQIDKYTQTFRYTHRDKTNYNYTKANIYHKINIYIITKYLLMF